MSTAIEIACEAAEQLCNSHLDLRLEEVAFGSRALAEALWPHLRLEHYDGPEGGLFADLRDLCGVASSFLALLEEDAVQVPGGEFLAELTALRAALQAQRARLPPLFELVDSSGQVFLELNRGRSRIACGYGHCALLSAEGDLLADLRRETRVSLEGRPLSVVRRDVCAAIEPELARIVPVARTATTFRRRVELRAT